MQSSVVVIASVAQGTKYNPTTPNLGLLWLTKDAKAKAMTNKGRFKLNKPNKAKAIHARFKNNFNSLMQRELRRLINRVF